MSGRAKWWWLGFGLGGAVVVAVVVLMVKPGSEATAGQAEAVERVQGEVVPALVVAVESALVERSYPVEVRYAGRVEAARRSSLGFELGGRVKGIGVREGQSVVLDQPLGELDTTRLVSAKTEAELAVKQAAASEALARLVRDRVLAAFARKGATEQERDEAVQGYAVAVAATARAQAAVDRVQTDIDKSQIKAPFDGVVVRRLVDEGAVVSAGQGVLELMESVGPEARVGVAGDAAERLMVGQRYTVEVDRRQMEAAVIAVLPVREARTRALEVLLRVEAQLGGVAGLASRSMPVRERRVGPEPLPVVTEGDLVLLSLGRRVEAANVALPVSALTEGVRGLWACYVAEPLEEDAVRADGATHRLARRDVAVLDQRVGEDGAVVVRVWGAVRAGELVVMDGLQRVMPGLGVRVVMGEGDGGADPRRDAVGFGGDGGEVEE
ncbi:MAG: HlyD family efflux transporter periplasmic adaptor subunit [Planctomycetota bacterium]